MFSVPVIIAPSDIHGYGVFTKTVIQPGRIVWAYEEEKELELFIDPDNYPYTYGRSEIKTLYPWIWHNPLTGLYQAALGLDRYQNHSDKAPLTLKKTSQLMFIANRKIDAYYELTYNNCELGGDERIFQGLRRYAGLEADTLDNLMEKKG